jgi:hypothetical protein
MAFVDPATASARQALVRADVGVAFTTQDSLGAILRGCVESVERHFDAALALMDSRQGSQCVGASSECGLYTDLDGTRFEHAPIGPVQIPLPYTLRIGNVLQRIRKFVCPEDGNLIGTRAPAELGEIWGFRDSFERNWRFRRLDFRGISEISNVPKRVSSSTPAASRTPSSDRFRKQIAATIIDACRLKR